MKFRLFACGEKLLLVGYIRIDVEVEVQDAEMQVENEDDQVQHEYDQSEDEIQDE